MSPRIALATLSCLALVPACGDHAGGTTDTLTSNDLDAASETLPEATPPDAAPDGDAELPPDPPEPIDLSVVPPEGAVVAAIADKPGDLVRGPKAEGQLGDFVLANHRVKVLIEGLRPAGGYRQFGGNLVDADLQPGGEDRLSELWLVWNLRAFRPDTIDVVSDGRDGLAVVRAAGRTTSYAWVQAILGDLLIADPIDLAVDYTYRLAPDSHVVELVVTFFNDQPEDADMRLPLVAMNMGDGAPAFTPGPGLATIDGGTIWPWTGGVGLARAYGFIPPADLTPVALFQETNVQISQLPRLVLAPGETRSLTFRIVIAGDGTTTIEAERARVSGATLATLEGRVSGETPWGEAEGEVAPSHTGGRAWVAVTREADVLALTPVAADGTWRTVVPPGEVSVQAFAPARGGSEPVLVDARTSHTVDLALPALGEVVARVRDPEGHAIPAQIAFFRADAPSPFAPEPVRFDPDWGSGRSMVLFQTESQATAHLLPGDYRVVASRGYSWEIADVAITVAPGTSQTLDLVIEHVVDDAGWSAADLHMHAFWSPDSEVPYPLRLRQAAANDVSLPVFTEHTYMGDLAAPIAEAAVADWVTPIPGQEVSTVVYGHFGAFPLVYDPTLPSGGAVFEHGWPGTELFDAIRAQHDGDLIVQVNHPRSSTALKAYFNAIGLDSETLVASRAPERWTTEWDTLEVFNTRCASAENSRTLEDWFNLNDHGFKKAVSSGSDSHSESDGIGNPRSWIEVSRAAVERDHEAIVAPLRERRAFVSCGPFVRFSTRDGVGMGGLATAESGEVRFVVRVEAPSWMQIDRVRLLENGAPIETLELATWPRPDGLRPAVRFDGELVARPTADAWYVVEVLGSGGLWPIEPGDDPYALTNPIDVDLDGDGAWTPPAQTRTTRAARWRNPPPREPARRHAHPHGAGHHH